MVLGVAALYPLNASAEGEQGAYTEDPAPEQDPYTEPPGGEGGGSTGDGEGDDAGPLDDLPGACAAEELEASSGSEGSAEWELRAVREAIRQVCRLAVAQAHQLSSLRASADAGRAAVRDSLLEDIVGELEGIRGELSDQEPRQARVLAATEYLADLLGMSAGEPVPLLVSADPVSGTVEVSNFPNDDQVVQATDDLRDTMHSNMWGLSGFLTGGVALGALWRMVRA